MQQEKNPQKKQELKSLEELILSVSACPIESAESERLKDLAFKYPCHTLDLFKKHKIIDGQPKPAPLMKAYCAGFALTWMYLLKLPRYLVHPPKDEKEQEEFDRIVVALEDIIQKQSKEN